MTSWADDEGGRLRLVTDQVSGMESALVTGRLAAGIAFADAVVAMTTDLLDELDLDPNRDPENDAERVSMSASIATPLSCSVSWQAPVASLIQGWQQPAQQ